MTSSHCVLFFWSGLMACDRQLAQSTVSIDVYISQYWHNGSGWKHINSNFILPNFRKFCCKPDVQTLLHKCVCVNVYVF